MHEERPSVDHLFRAQAPPAFRKRNASALEQLRFCSQGDSCRDEIYEPAGPSRCDLVVGPVEGPANFLKVQVLSVTGLVGEHVAPPTSIASRLGHGLRALVPLFLPEAFDVVRIEQAVELLYLVDQLVERTPPSATRKTPLLPSSRH